MHLQPSNIDTLVTVVGHGAEDVQIAIGDDSEFALQEEQLGTAHAVLQAEPLLKGKKGTTMVVCGDTPLITSETFRKLFEYHENTQVESYHFNDRNG